MAEELWNDGIATVVPQLSFFEEMVSPRPPKEWLEQYLEHLQRCDAVLRLEGESKVADRQVARAKELGMLLFFTYKELLDFIREGLDGDRQ